MASISRKRLFKLLALLLILSLFLAACERPFPGDDPDATETAEQVEEEATPTTDAPTPDTDDPDVGGGVPGDETPEPEEEAAPTVTEAPTEEPPEAPTAVPTETPTPDAADEDAEAEDEEEMADEDEEETAVDEEDEDVGGGAPDDTADAEEDEMADAEEEAADEDAEAAADETDEAAGGGTAATTHVVQPGENLYRIGLAYGQSWVNIAQANGITDPNQIYVGQTLTIPSTQGSGQPEPQPTPSPATETTHVVQPGENLFRIGLAYNLSWVQIAEANGLVNPNQIYAGQVLKIPVDVPGPPPQFTHVVQPGETLFRIALQYGVPWQSVAQAHNLAPPHVIYPGQTLVIPGG